MMRELKIKPVIPVYIAGLVWVLCVLALPMYRWYDLAIAAGISLLAYKISSILIPVKTILVESKPEPINTGNSELDEILNAGNAYMTELSNFNAKIVNEKINRQVNEMMSITKHIFDFITKNPLKVRQIRQFMNYYLPTAVKLLNNYNELQKQGSKGENIVSAMKKIEGVMDKIIDVFKKVLDDLFMDKALDISVDIEVLEKMIKEES